ncbi:MAG: hypothetical protein ACT6QM_06060 [Brevundimonas mediterranea]|uniref:hypothetical protein n=1 Tax=Brevundimonas mediterranea TaxID=74329 RepID=UPI0040347DD2
MVDRTILGRRNDGSYGMDISFPGFNVHTASNTQLAFSTRWAHAASIHQTGTIARGGTVNFPTLPYVPTAMAMVIEGSTYRPGQFLLKMTPTQLGMLPDGIAQEPLFEVTASSFRLMPTHPKYFADTYGANVPSQSYRYVIFRIPGGA